MPINGAKQGAENGKENKKKLFPSLQSESGHIESDLDKR